MSPYLSPAETRGARAIEHRVAASADARDVSAAPADAQVSRHTIHHCQLKGPMHMATRTSLRASALPRTISKLPMTCGTGVRWDRTSNGGRHLLDSRFAEDLGRVEHRVG